MFTSAKRQICVRFPPAEGGGGNLRLKEGGEDDLNSPPSPSPPPLRNLNIYYDISEES